MHLLLKEHMASCSSEVVVGGMWQGCRGYRAATESKSPMVGRFRNCFVCFYILRPTVHQLYLLTIGVLFLLLQRDSTTFLLGLVVDWLPVCLWLISLWKSPVCIYREHHKYKFIPPNVHNYQPYSWCLRRQACSSHTWFDKDKGVSRRNSNRDRTQDPHERSSVPSRW